ncbi:MAG: HAMP domain-containing protein [Lachnoclostridium sp.]
MTKQKKMSGIQRKYLKYTIALLVVALLLSSIGIWQYMRRNLTGVIIDKYKFMNEKMGITLDNLFTKSDEVTAECIVYDDVQKSLKVKTLEEVKRNALSKYFAYIDLDHVSDYCYIDNKQNVYTRSYSHVSYDDFKESGFEELLGEDYARTKWIWTEDTLFGTKSSALFIGRYVRSMEYSHDPGMLFFKMNDGFLEEIIGNDKALTGEVAVGILDAKGELCKTWMPQNYEVADSDMKMIRELAENEVSGVIADGEMIDGGILSAYRQADSGMVVFTLVPNDVLNRGLNRILLVMITIYLFVIAAAVVLSIYFSQRFTKPIQEISKAMTGFDGNDFTGTVQLHTNTELDQIGHSYNEMLGNIKRPRRSEGTGERAQNQ